MPEVLNSRYLFSNPILNYDFSFQILTYYLILSEDCSFINY